MEHKEGEKRFSVDFPDRTKKKKERKENAHSVRKVVLQNLSWQFDVFQKVQTTKKYSTEKKGSTESLVQCMANYAIN